MVNNFISGLILLVERPIKVGDLVEVQDVVGAVQRIGLRSTRVRSGDNTHIIVPNSAFLEQNVHNWTVSDDVMRVGVDVGVAYGSPTDRVAELLVEAAEASPRALAGRDVEVLFTDFAADALTFRVLFWIQARAALDTDRARSDVRFRIDEAFRRAEITIAFPQRDVHLDSIAPVEVRLLEPRPRGGSVVSESIDATTPWWGEHRLEQGQAVRCRVGPLSVWIRRHAREWCVHTVRSDDRLDSSVEVVGPVGVDETPPPEEGETIRYVSDRPGHALRIVPALADRMVIVRPDGACRVLAGAEVTLYVSSPLWFRAETATENGRPGRPLVDQAIVQPTRTWFGPSTVHGEVGFALRTPAAVDPAALAPLPSRAVTRVHLINRGSDDLDLVRLSLPAPNLGLWRDSNHAELGLFTSSVTVERSGAELADVRVDRRAPPELDTPERVGEPRSIQQRHFLARAMSSILS